MYQKPYSKPLTTNFVKLIKNLGKGILESQTK